MWLSRSKKAEILCNSSSQSFPLSTTSYGTLASEQEIFSQISLGFTLEGLTSNRSRTKKTFLTWKEIFAAVLSLKERLILPSLHLAWRSRSSVGTEREIPKMQRDHCSITGRLDPRA